MAKHKFTATHGVHLWDLGVQFARAEDRIDGDGKGRRQYVFETDDPKVAAAVAKVDGYGIKKASVADADSSDD